MSRKAMDGRSGRSRGIHAIPGDKKRARGGPFYIRVPTLLLAGQVGLVRILGHAQLPGAAGLGMPHGGIDITG